MQQYQVTRTDNITILHPQKHLHTLIWIHGLNMDRQSYLDLIIKALGKHTTHTRVVIPKAPLRFVTASNKEASSWFDIKFRSEKSFIVPFDQAFSSKQVHDSFNNILKPIIEKQSSEVKNTGGKMLVCGFSQGCGMSLHCLFALPHLIDGAVGISGYLFPISAFDAQLQKDYYVIYGLADKLRPWQWTKTTYEGKVAKQRIQLIQGMDHQVNQDTARALGQKLQALLECYGKL